MHNPPSIHRQHYVLIKYTLSSPTQPFSSLLAPAMPPPLRTLLLGVLLLSSSMHAPPRSAAAPARGGHDTLAVGQVLAAGDKLVSGNGKFALGFFQPRTSKPYNTTTSSSGWYLGIWFNKIPVFTTVWVANRDKPITDTQLKLTQLKISSNGDLVIIVVNSDGGTESTIWSTTHTASRTETSRYNTSALLMNSGNLALVAEKTPFNTTTSGSDVVLWQSFDHPTDVGLPGAKLGWNKVTGLNHQYISKKSLIDPGLGSYGIELDTNGVAVLRRRSHPSLVYWSWSSENMSYKLIAVIKSLVAMDSRTKGLFEPLYVHNNEEQYFTYTSSDESSSVIVLIDVTGQLKLNVWSQARQSWETIYALPNDPCDVYATCGPFTVCDDNSRPSCACMESFSQKSPQDWELGDRTGGCIRNTPLDCTGKSNMTSSTDVFLPIARVTLPYHPQNIDGAATQSQCAQFCLTDCSCTAYSYNSSICSVWHGELLEVKLNDGTDNTSEDVLYLRLAAKDSQGMGKPKRKPIVGFIAAAAASSATFGLLILVMLVMVWRNKFKCCGVPLRGSQGIGGVIAFRYTDLDRATKNFSERLGGGGFGSVFKGVLSDSINIAVKRLDGARQGEKQFRAEVSSIGLIQHINLVKLIGFCCEGDKRLLVYEHMLNGSLDAHLFQSNATVLNWSTRYQIAKGVARGLSYLHQSCRECIIHCDIKPENILLDASFIPKIADFGMAAFVGRDFSRVLTTARGTAGYLAPEWLSGVPITPKVDVYSFGMVLLEIMSGRRNSPEVYTSSGYRVAYFPVQAINRLHEGDVRSLVDPKLHGGFDLEEAERLCKIACWCIQDNEFDRPTMADVVRVLEGLQELYMPPMPRLLAAITECSDEA